MKQRSLLSVPRVKLEAGNKTPTLDKWCQVSTWLESLRRWATASLPEVPCRCFNGSCLHCQTKRTLKEIEAEWRR